MTQKIFTLGNILTLANLTCGITALVLVIGGDLWFACLVLVLGAAFDFFDGKISKESDAGIGAYIVKKDFIYGKFGFGIFFGKYLLSFGTKKGFDFCNFYATGTGG